MTRRIRCDCKLRGLPAAQRVKVDAWLFEEGFTYEEVAGECLRQFGLKVSRSSVGRYYERTSADRVAEKKRKERMALQPELSPAEADEVLLQRIGTIALELMDEEVVERPVPSPALSPTAWRRGGRAPSLYLTVMKMVGERPAIPSLGS